MALSYRYISCTKVFTGSLNTHFQYMYTLQMSEDAVVNWDSIIHKNVRSKDGQDAGNVDAIEGDTVVITSEGDREEYNLPKSEVEGYNDAEIS